MEEKDLAEIETRYKSSDLVVFGYINDDHNRPYHYCSICHESDAEIATSGDYEGYWLQVKGKKIEHSPNCTYQDVPNLIAEIRRLRETLEITDKLLDRYKVVISTIPECRLHGDQCLPNAADWIKSKL